MAKPTAKKMVFNNKRSNNGWVRLAVKQTGGAWEYQTPQGPQPTPATESMNVAGDKTTTLPKMADGTAYDISPAAFASAQVLIYADPEMNNLAGTLVCNAPAGMVANAITVEIEPQSSNPNGTMTLYMAGDPVEIQVCQSQGPVGSIAN